MTSKNTGLAVSEAKAKLVPVMAAKYGIEPDQFMNTIKATVFPAGKQVSNEQACMFLVVANEYNLNPFIKEIYAFPGRSGGIVPVVSVDGWLTIINRQPQLDGIEFEDHVENGKLTAVTAKIYRKDRARPTEVTEYMSECARATDTWKQWPNRMLRHKATIQAARYAFGLSGIYEPDEAERIQEAIGREVKAVGKELVAVITEPQRVTLVEAAKRNGHNLGAIVNSAGYTLLAEIPSSRYEEILAIVEEPKVKMESEVIAPDPTPIDDSDAIHGEPVFDPDESILEDLRAAVTDMLAERVKPADQKAFLKGRVIGHCSAEQLEEMLHQLQDL